MATLFGGSGDAEKGRLAATLTLVSGETLNGHVFVKGAGYLRDLINSQDQFLEFERRDHTHVHVAKASIQTIAAIDLPRNDQLQRRTRDLAAFDPYLTLGIERNAGASEIRAAYWGKARAYHPDKLAGVGAPKEVLDYMNATFMRIHAAYRELTGETAPAPPA